MLNRREDDEAAYAAANAAIIREAQTLSHDERDASPQRPIAVVVWEGKPQSGSDATASFLFLATEAGFA